MQVLRLGCVQVEIEKYANEFWPLAPCEKQKGNIMADERKVATLSLDGKEYDLPVLSPTAGPDVVDIRKLYADAGVFTYDPGFTSTASCDSEITYIDGNKGELLHRGYRSINWLKNLITSKFAIFYFIKIYLHLHSLKISRAASQIIQ